MFATPLKGYITKIKMYIGGSIVFFNFHHEFSENFGSLAMVCNFNFKNTCRPFPYLTDQIKDLQTYVFFKLLLFVTIPRQYFSHSLDFWKCKNIYTSQTPLK